MKHLCYIFIIFPKRYNGFKPNDLDNLLLWQVEVLKMEQFFLICEIHKDNMHGTDITVFYFKS